MKHTRPKVCSRKDRLSYAEPEKGAVKKCMNDTDITPPPVISTVGAEWRNLTPKCGKPMVAGNLSALRFIRAQNPCPIPAGSPIEMTMPADSTQSFQRDKLQKNAAPRLVISTAAERSGEISLRNVASPWWQEISRLCVSLEPKILAPYRQVPRSR